MNTVFLDKNNFTTYIGQIVDLFLHAFTTGEFSQYIDNKEAEKYLNKLLSEGFGLLAFSDDKLMGAIIATSLSFDKEFPSKQNSDISIEKSVYIAEVMVHAEGRGKGIATLLINELLDNKRIRQYSDAVIRVWDKNIPAVSLYKKLGFEETGISIQQTKYRLDNEIFLMRKIYLKKTFH